MRALPSKQPNNGCVCTPPTHKYGKNLRECSDGLGYVWLIFPMEMDSIYFLIYSWGSVGAGWGKEASSIQRQNWYVLGH